MSSTYHRAFSWGVTPWLIITREDTHVASTNEFFIIKTKNRIVTIQKVGVEDNLHAVVTMIEKFYSAYLVENGIIRIVGHVVSNDGGQGIPLQGENATLQKHLVFLGKEFFW